MTTPATLIETEVTSSQPLILRGEGYGLDISPAYELKKTQLLNAAALIARVNNAEDDLAADSQIKALAAMRIEVEKCRTTVKAPAIKFGKDVDEKAKAFSATIDAEETRLKKARGEYAVMVEKERQRVLAEIEAKRQAEAKRIREEEAAAAKIEADRIAAEQAQWEADSPEEEAAAAEALEAAKAAELKRLEEVAAIITAPATVAFVPAAPKGVKMVANYKVTDLDALYHHNVSLVKMEPKRAEILEAIARGKIGNVYPTIPGLEIFEEAYVR